jgi:transposase
MKNGNSSDETLNNEELQRIAKLLKPLEKNIGEVTYIADCKLITTGNLRQLQDLLFISRFPANFKEHDRVIGEATPNTTTTSNARKTPDSMSKNSRKPAALS